ncbi:TlpA family protein disulfide reductase [Compostimonas suwonensis]|uniref:Peroxiredoxin n=1 Tax=Compostimonas suwonensis TaxID=1048394 RepID=A0A2M9BZX5_9MICO|nr:TlpA disulfide reductase family protein [Compostimonas suwonensis]PJJ63643.1 peroxiredoxin [Compostimonas suwonensis]
MRQARLLLLGAALLALTACSSPSPQTLSELLPGPVPSGVEFAAPPADAADAPDPELTFLDGEKASLSDFWSERPVVLVFLEPWCQECADQQSELNTVVSEYGDRVLFLGVAGEGSRDEVRDYVDAHDIRYPVALDGRGVVWRAYGVQEAPLVALISKDGKLLRGWPGGVPELGAQLEDLVLR